MLAIGLLNADFIMSNCACSIAGVSGDFYPIETLNFGKGFSHVCCNDCEVCVLDSI